MSSQDRVRKYTRGGRRRKPMLDVDLNVAPQMPCGQEGTSNHASSQDRQDGNTQLAAAIDLDAYDDDVIISSPRAFAEAKNNSRRNHGRTVVVDLESEERSTRNKRARFPTSQTICDFYINLEGGSNSNSVRNTGQRATLAAPPPLPKEPTFSCPVCMGTLVEEMSTKCGHIFCKACIKAAIAAQAKCPTCRRKVTTKDIIRIYLPATNST
ncbi:hypothetical protein F511_04771 [Dorcoceras hygrometricum]|uniref:RING-type domain-containing protein n=1 Tax=Dorcoceras hygrometricum TaxID=472368 RepID=A0A2Z7AXN9_9LAMI|nr:hypothetical protein F511_04771 [Dorcoceras hygrometricum]